MALPWAVFSRAELATSNIVEDLKLGQELADAGHAPLFVEQATVWSAAETEGTPSLNAAGGKVGTSKMPYALHLHSW